MAKSVDKTQQIKKSAPVKKTVSKKKSLAKKSPSSKNICQDIKIKHGKIQENELFPIDMNEKNDKVLVKQLMQQMSGVGFCLLTNVEGHDEETLLKAIKAFHELPLEVKM